MALESNPAQGFFGQPAPGASARGTACQESSDRNHGCPEMSSLSCKSPAMDMPDEVRLQDSPCPLGCINDDEFVLEGRDRLHGLQGIFHVVRCTGCGLMRTNPRPTPETMAYYYPEDYGPYKGTQVRTAPSGQPDKANGPLRTWAKRFVDFRSHAIPHLQPGRMLEIGCASGAFMHRMARLDWDVHGIEFSATAAARARDLGYPVFAGSVEDAAETGELNDLIVGWMVLEHLHEPVAALRKLRRMATPHAWLVLSVPDAGSFEFRMFGNAWYALQLPNHLYHFTPTTLTRMLKAAGLAVHRIFHQRVTNLPGSVALAWEERHPESSWARRLRSWALNTPLSANLALFPLEWLLASFGRSGRMTVWARPMNDQHKESP